MITNINSEDRLVQQTFADYLQSELGWESVYAYNNETFGPQSLLGRSSERDVVLVRDLRAAISRLNPALPAAACDQAVETLTRVDAARSLLQHNQDNYDFIRNGVPVNWHDDASGETRHERAHVIDFRDPENNRFLAVRELKIQGVRVPHYNRRADLVCFVNGLPLVFVELKAVYRNIRAGFDDNLTDYMSEVSIAQAFHHNAFLVVSNGDHARYGSITSQWERFLEWKRNAETEPGRLDARMLLDGMLAKDRLLDLLENFILFDASRPGGTRKVIARNHQVLGVNNAVASVLRQEDLKKQFPPDERLRYRTAIVEMPQSHQQIQRVADAPAAYQVPPAPRILELPLVERAHPDLGRLGVFWHTQGSGKSYSMAFFAEKVRRTVPGNFTFLIMTDREDLDDQIWRTFVGCSVSNENTPRASSGPDLRRLLAENHRYIFSLMHKFNQTVTEPYSTREDIIVISDEAHRTQSGAFARNMRRALPNAAFIGFTGTPLFRDDELTRRIFGTYVSRYDFRRSEEDGSTVKLVYENRGEKLGIARFDLNDRIADAIEQADLDPDQVGLLEKLLGKDYEVITADDRLAKLADDFVDHCSSRWRSVKSMLVCIDKVTCGRMLNLIEPRWQTTLTQVSAQAAEAATALANATDPDKREALTKSVAELTGRAAWMSSTIIELIISEAQNEARDFARWGVDIVPHRVVMKQGFETPDGKRVNVEDAFRDADHPFRIAIVCAMWLTGFDVESLSTLYVDKPMKAHNLMQAIARANRVYPGKDCGLIVDYNGVTQALRAALAQYALGDDANPDDGVIIPIEELVAALIDALEEAENHLRLLGFDPQTLIGAKGFDRIEGLRDATEALYSSDEAKRRFEILARQVLIRFRTLIMEPSVYAYAERQDNIEAIYKKLQEKRDTADLTDLLKSLHRIVNEAIRAAEPGEDETRSIQIDLSQLDFEKLREEFSTRAHRKNTVLNDLRDLVEAKLAQMMARNPARMDYYLRYQDIIAAYNREKDRATVEQTFADLMALVGGLDVEERRAVKEGLTEDELALFDMLLRDGLAKADRELLKQASRDLLASLMELIRPMHDWTKNSATQAKVQMFVLDNLWQSLPRPPFTDQDAQDLSDRIYNYVWERSSYGTAFVAA